MKHVRIAMFALALIGLADVASAVTRQWTNAGGTGNGLWTDPLNWNPNGVPTSADTVEIGASVSAVNCTLNTSTSVAGLTILNPGTPPTLTVTGSATLTVNGPASVAAGGTLSATVGATVNLNGGGSSSGTFSSGASSVIAFGGGHTANAGSAFAGTGEFRITGGLFVVPAAASVSIPNLKFSGGYLTGGGTVTLTGAPVWSGGSMGEGTQPGGTTVVDSAATLTLPGGAYTYLEQRTLTNNGTIVYATSPQYLTIQAVSTVNNAGTFDIQSDQLIYIGGAGPNVFSNTGTLQKTLGPGTAAIHARLDNSGTVASTSGTLSIVGGGSSTAAFSAGAGGTIQFAANYTINTGSTFTGAGGFQVSFGNFVVPAAVSVTIPNFSILNGSSYLSGAGTVTLTGAATWAGGYMGHPSSPGGTTIVDPAATLTINGAGGYATIDQSRTLTNNGTIQYTAVSNYLSIYNGSTINNANTFNIATDQQISAAGSGPNAINNTGTFQKTSGSGTSFIYAQLNNSGTVATTAGAISINGGGASSGAFSAGAGTNIDFASTYTANAGSSFGGTGNYRINNGNLVVPGAASVSIANLTIMSGGSYLSGAGTVTLTGAVTWTAGSMGVASAPGGTTIIDPGATVAINGSYTYLDQGRTLTNNGTINYGPTSSYLSIYNGSTLNNAGTFNIQNDQGIVGSGTGTPTFNNSGTLEKTGGTGTSTITALVNNTGTLTASAGELALNAGGTHSGAFSAGAGATLTFGGGTHAIVAPSTLSAAGAIRFSGGTVDIAGTYNVAGTTRVTGGTARFNAAASTAVLDLSGGILGGTGTFTVTTSGTWSGGYMNGPGTTVIDPVASLAMSGTSTYSYLDAARVLTNNGTIVYAPATYQLSQYNGSTINNAGLFDVQTNFGIAISGVSNVFNNSGTLRKSVATGASTFGVAVNNTGIVDVTTGTLSFQGGGTASGAFTFAVSIAANLDFESTYTVSTGGLFTTGGNYRINNGNLVIAAAAVTIPNLSILTGSSYLSGSGTVTLAGTATWAAGYMGHSSNPGGTTIIGPTATLNVTNGSYKYVDQGRTLTNNGTINYNVPTYYLSIYNGSTLNNAGTFDIQSDTGVSWSGVGNVFNNSGTLQKTGGTGISDFTVLVNNSGSVSAATGTLSLNGGGTHSGSFSPSGTGTVRFGGGTHTSASGTYSGAGTLAFTAGSVTLSGTTIYSATTTQVTGAALVVNVNGNTVSLAQTGGYLGGTGTFTITGSATWSGGTWGEPSSPGGTTVIDPGVTLLLNGASTYTYLGYGRTLNNNGTINYTAPTYYLNFYLGGTLNNAGTFTIQTDQGMVPSGTGNLFSNAGALQKTAGTGTSTISVVVNNTGSVLASSGTLALNGGGTHTGSFTATAPGTVQFGGGTHSSTSGAYGGTGTFIFSNGPVTLSGTSTYNAAITRVTGGTAALNVNGSTASLDQSGGYLGGAGTFTITGSATWSGGTWGEPSNPGGTTIINPGVTLLLNGASTYTYLGYGRTLNNNGAITYTAPTYYLNFYLGGTLNNAGTFDLQTDQGMVPSGTGNLFSNAGVFQKTAGAGISNISVPLNNTGSVLVSTGTLSLNGGGTHTGSFNAPAPGTLQFGGGTHSSASGSYGGTGTVIFSSGTVTLSGSTTYNAAATRVISSTTALNVNASTVSLNQSGGYLGGTGTFTITGSATWSGGTWGEPSNPGGTTVLDPGVNLLLNGASTYSYLGYGRTLNNNGSITYTATTYYLNFYLGGTLNNAGTFDIQTDQGIVVSGTGNLFSNTAVLQKTTGSGISAIGVPLNNNGSVLVSAGTLSLNGGGTHGGSFTATSPGAVQFNGGNHSSSSGSYAGTGTFIFSSGNVLLSGTTTYSPATTRVANCTAVFNVGATTSSLEQTGGYLGGTGTFTITGSSTWSGGTWGEPVNTGGTTVIDPGASVLLDAASTYAYLGYGRTLINNGTITYSATSYYLHFYLGGTLNNAGTIDVQTDQGFVVSGGPNQLNNSGTFRKSAGTATSTFSVPFANSGVVEALSGISAFNGGYTQTAGVLTLNGGGVSSTTPLAIQGGIVGGTGAIAATVSNSGGTMRPGLSPGTLSISGNYTQGPAAALETEIAGASSSDLLAISGTATLDGTLNVLNIGGYTPANGAGFQIVTYSTRSGDFATKNGLSYVGGAYTYNLNATDITLTAGSTADVTVSKTAPATVAINQTFNYSIVVSNLSTIDAATDVTLTDNLSAAGVVLNSITPPAGWTCAGTTTVTCTATLLGASSSATFTFNVTAPGSAGSITNTASVASVNEPATNNTNNSSAAATNVVAVEADVSVTVTSPASTTPGNPIIYAVSVNNAGPVTATNVVVTASIPPGVTGASFTTTPSTSCTLSGASVTCTFASIGATGSATLTISTTAADGGSMTVNATASASESDPNPANNSGSSITTVTGSSTLVVRVTADGGNSSLRQALVDLQNGLCVAPCTITFAIPGAGPHTIALLSQLPTGTVSTVTIDGATQPGYSGTPLVHVDGSALSPGSSGFYILGSAWTMRGIAVHSVPGYGMFFSGGSGHSVVDNYLGTNGSSDLGNLYDGLLFGNGSGSNVISGNVISGNTGGIRIFGTSSGNVITANFIGVGADGSTSLPNSSYGISFQTGATATVGGLTPADANIISSNGAEGVLIESGISGVEILGNSFSANGGLAIDDGAGAGAPPTPSIASAELSGGNLHVTVSSDATSAAGTTALRIELYQADSLASAEGSQLLTSVCLTGNLLTNAVITVPAGSTVPGTPIVATATPYSGPSCSGITANTSEFSAAVAAASCTPPVVTIATSGPTTFCAPGTVTLTANPAGLTYLWSTGATTQSITVSATGTYSVTATNSLGCPASASQSVTVNPVPPTPVITASGPTTFCTGGSVTLTAPASASYLWSNGATTQSITVSASGSYGVTVTNASGCSSSPSSPVSVTVNPTPPAPTITASGPTTFCQGGSVTLTASAGSSWLWSNGATTQSVTIFSGGNYSVTVADGNGCTATSAPTPVTVTAPPNVQISGPSALCGTGSVTLTVEGSGISSVTWSTGATSTSITVSPTSTTTYSAVVVAGSCTTTVSHRVTVSNAGPPLSINAPASVPALSTGNVASVPGGAAQSYTWSIFNGAITSGQGTPAITFTAGESGAVTLNVTMDSSGCPSNGTTTIAIESCATTPPALISPAPGIASAQSPVRFEWSAVPGAIDYEVWRVVTGSSPALIGTTVSTSLSADVPSGSYGWYVTARLQQSCNPQRLTSTEVRAITVVPSTNCPTLVPALVAPGSGTTPFSPVFFDWTGVPDAIGYRVMVSLGGLPAIELDSTDSDTTELIAEVPVGAVSWWVEAIYPGCPSVTSAIGEFRVELEDCAKHERARLISPSDNAVADSSAVTFSWAAVDGADGYAVWAVLDDGPSKIGETLGATSLSAVVPFGRREWYVETLFEGCPSTESDHRFLVVPASANCSAAAPELATPAAGSTVSSPLVTFSWSSVSGALLYELWLSVGGGAEALIARTTSTSITSEVPAGAISWFVRARLNGCPHADSARRELRYEPPSGCSTMVPMPLLPMDDGRPITSPVAFRWTAVPGATQYKLYLGRGANGVFELKATTSVPEANGIAVSNGESRWFVEAIFNGCPSTRSSNSRFVAVPVPNTCIDLAAPVISLPGQVSAGTPYTVQWSAVPGAESYLLTEFIGSTARTMTITGQSAQFNYDNQSGQGHMYVYRVRGVDHDCQPAREGALSTELGISILPARSSEASALVGSQSAVQHTIAIGADRAGQTFTASAVQPWITIVPSSGVVPPAGIDLVATADVTGLPLGTSIGSVIVTFGGGAGSRQVTTANGPVTSPISVSLVTPVTPTPKSTPPPDALIIPAVAHADGINAQFRSDVRVSNTSPQVMKYQLTFVPSGEAGITQGRQTTLDIEPGRTIALDDVLRSWFGTGDSSILGTLEIRPLTQSSSATSSAATRGVPNFVTFASSRTFNQTPNGTFGTYIAAIPFANFIGRSTDSSKSVLSMQQIAQSGVYRSNLGFVEGTGNPAELLVSVFASSGAKITDFPVSLTGGQHLQMNSFLATKGIQLEDGRLEVQVTSGTGRVTSYASVVNNATGDSLVVTPTTLGEATSSKYVLPGVAELSGGVVWQTDVRLFNAGTQPVMATLTLESMNGSPQQQASVELAAGEVKQLDRILATLFGVANDGGALHITTESASKLVATARTFRPAGDGANFGQFIQAVTPDQAIALGSRPLQLLQVEESPRFRSNVGIAEVSGRSAKVELTVIPPDSKVSAKIEVDLAANQFRQLNSLLSAMGLEGTHNARVTVKVIGGQGRVTAYAATIDASTQDPTFIPAQ